jgi:serine/threonine protein kinase
MVYVAEGTYGCVYRPPIKCKNGIKYPVGKISKLMTRHAAVQEENEYKLIKRADKKNKYYPGPPIRCEPDPADAKNEMKPDECELFEKDPDITKYELLIYTDGGHDLKQFVSNELDKYLASNSQEQTDLFFLNAYNLFQGIKLFLANDILHHDIKPQNIVFNAAKHRFNYIDFGLIEKKNKLINDIISGKTHENFHWSYPLEFGFMNSNKDYDYTKITDFKSLENDFIEILTDPAFENQTNKYGIKPKSFQHVFKYMEDRINPFSKEDFIKQVFAGLVYCKQNNISYPEFVKKLLSNTDIYSLGFSMNYVLNKFYDKGAITKDQYEKYRKLFRKMCSANLNGRTAYSIDEYAAWYEKILTETGVLMRLDKTISNGEIKDTNASFESEIINTALTRIQDILKTCPPGKEINPSTRRCRKICPPNQLRDNKTGKCKKVKVVDLISDSSTTERSKTRKACPPGKEFNYMTSRCRVKCKQGTIRNQKGRCVRDRRVPI